MLEQANDARIWRNTISSTTVWQTGGLGEAHGVVVINGDRVRVQGNDISNALFGLWAYDHDGQSRENKFHDNFIGLILCKVPAGAIPLPSGELVGSEFSGTSWLVKNNRAQANFDTGYRRRQ